jgi:tetratricopeptide (TPR) repeat protein
MQGGTQTVLSLVAAGAACAGGWTIPKLFGPEAMPQARGGDLIALVLGDARNALGDSFIHKADEYFHGGQTFDTCTEAYAHGEADGHEEHEEHEHARRAPGIPLFDWLDSHVHAQEHRHLTAKESSEMLPWFWAACKAAPHNTAAFEDASYVLSRMGRDPDALTLLEDGIRNNPADAGLEFSRGELLLHRLRRPADAEAAFNAALDKCRDDNLLKVRALFYVGYLAKQRGDLTRLRFCTDLADSIAPKNESALGLHKLLSDAAPTPTSPEALP